MVAIATDVSSLFLVLSSSGSSRCFQAAWKKKKIQNEEVLTHGAPQILPEASRPDGPKI